MNTPSNDIDLFYPIAPEVFQRFDSYSSNGQSALLQDVREALLVTYPQTTIGGDGQVVAVQFNTLTVEVVPVFHKTSQLYLVPDTKLGGRWTESAPGAEVEALNLCDTLNNYNCRKLTRIMKIWRTHCNVPIKSFWLENLMTSYLPACQWRQNDYFYYDWLVRDFLEYLVSKANSYIIVPGTYELINIGDTWLSRAESAYARAKKACDYERDDEVLLAGLEWHKIFGEAIPIAA